MQREWRRIASTWYQYVALGFCGMVACGSWVYVAAQSAGAVNIALIYSAAPVLILIGSVFWLRERMGWLQVLGVVLALGGVLHVIAKANGEHSATSAS